MIAGITIIDHAVKLRDFIINLLFPIECLDCGQEGEWLCGGCLLKLKLENNQACQGCGQLSLNGSICPDCRLDWALDGVLAALDYDRAVAAKLIKALKYNFVKDIGAVLAGIFLKFYRCQLTQGLIPTCLHNKLIFIPVPLHPKRLRWRGFNQSELLARPIVRALGGELLLDTLVRDKNVTPQTQFAGAERLKNIDGSFKFTGNTERLKGRIVVLVDDVVTTGATMNECAKVIKKQGAKKVWGFAVARG